MNGKSFEQKKTTTYQPLGTSFWRSKNGHKVGPLQGHVAPDNLKIREKVRLPEN